MLLVDVMFAQLSVLRANKIRNSGEGGKFVNLSEKAKPGDVITVSIEAIQTSQRRGVEGKKSTYTILFCIPPLIPFELWCMTGYAHAGPRMGAI